MKIIYLTPGCFDKGGISRYSRYQISALRELFSAENVHVYSVLGPGEEDFEGGCDVTYYAGGVSPSRKLAYFRSVFSGALTFRPDVILSAHINLSGLARVLSILTAAKSVLNVYGAEVWSAKRRDAAWGLKTADHVISDCHYTARYLEDNGLRPSGTVAVAWDCVDTSRFYPGRPDTAVLKKYNIPDPTEGLNLLTLGRMSSDTDYKGYTRLLDVFARLANSLPSLRLIYGGRGSLVEELRARACALGVADRVFFTGMIHEDDLADVYRSAHMFSLVSDRGEGTGEGIPLTPLEAAACGVPLLVGNQDGSQEAVIKGANGFIVNPFAPDEQADAIVSLARDEGLRARMGSAAQARIEREFGFPNFLEKHRELFASWLPGRFCANGGRNVQLNQL